LSRKNLNTKYKKEIDVYVVADPGHIFENLDFADFVLEI